jgi:hypothetical protein
VETPKTENYLASTSVHNSLPVSSYCYNICASTWFLFTVAVLVSSIYIQFPCCYSCPSHWMTGELQLHSKGGVSGFCLFGYVQIVKLVQGHLPTLLFVEGCFHGGNATRA